MKLALSYVCAVLFCGTAFGLIMGVVPYQIEITKGKNGELSIDVVNLRAFKSVADAADWCYQTHKATEGRKVWYSNVVSIDFSKEFTDKEIEDICWKFVEGKVYPSQIRRINQTEVIAERYSPGFLGHNPME